MAALILGGVLTANVGCLLVFGLCLYVFVDEIFNLVGENGQKKKNPSLEEKLRKSFVPQKLFPGF